MPRTTVKAHPRKGTRGVRGHSRTVKSKREVPSRRDATLSSKEIATIKKILEKEKLVKNYSIKRGSYDSLDIDVNFKSEEMDFGAPPGQSHEIDDYSIMFNISRPNGMYELTAYESYHFRLRHKFRTIYRKKVKKFSTVAKNIKKSIDMG